MSLTRALTLFAVAFVIGTAWSQEPVTNPLTLHEAVERAKHFPSVEASAEQVNAAAAGIRLARTNYLPSLNALGQVNRATRNNVFGLLLPQAILPNISGPVLGTDNGTSVWGSAVGVLVSWEPFDFGRRRALMKSAQATQSHAQLTSNRTRFDVETRTVAAFLTLLAMQQTAQAAQSAVDRAEVLVRSVTALVNAELRPGADLSRADTELDAAQTQRMQAARAVGEATAALAELTGIATNGLSVNPGALLQLPPDTAFPKGDFANSPAAKEQQALIAESEARLRVLQSSYRPTFELQASAYARGSGALTDGSSLGTWNGLAPTYFNGAAGLTVTFPLFALPSIRAQAAQEEAIGRSAAASYRQVLADLQAQFEAAESTLVQARGIAAETPKEIADARTGFEQANAQYRAGLTGVVAVAEAQRFLAQAEIDNSLAHLSVWRALLEIQIAQGDVSSFLGQASR